MMYDMYMYMYMYVNGHIICKEDVVSDAFTVGPEQMLQRSNNRLFTLILVCKV